MGWSIPSALVHGRTAWGTGPRLFLRWTRSCRPVVFTVSPRLGFMKYHRLGLQHSTNHQDELPLQQPTIIACHMALALCCRLIRSHTRFMHGPLVIWRNAGRLTFRHPSELHAGSRNSVPSRSFQGASRVGIMRSSVAPPDRFDFDLQHGFRAVSDHVKTPGSLDLSAIGSRRSPLRVRSCHEHRRNRRIALHLAQWRYTSKERESAANRSHISETCCSIDVVHRSLDECL